MHTFYKAPYFFICHQWFLWRMFNQFWIFLNSFVFQSRRQLSWQSSATYQAKLQNSTDASNKKKEVTAHCKIHPILSPIWSHLSEEGHKVNPTSHHFMKDPNLTSRTALALATCEFLKHSEMLSKSDHKFFEKLYQTCCENMFMSYLWLPLWIRT